MAAQPWYDYPIPAAGSHAAGDDGDDIDVPNDTPLSFPEAGQVIDASYHVYGGQVVVHMPDGWDEYFIHLDHVDVTPGEEVAPGQVIGSSGGGVGDNVLHNGTVQPAQAQSWYEGHSTGYHSEYGLFEDTSANGDMAQFNQGWGNHSRQQDPTSIIDALRAGTAPTSSTSSPTSSTSSPTLDAAQGLLPDPSQWASGALNGIATNLGFSSPANMAQRGLVGAAGLALALIGLYVAVQPEVQPVIEQTAKSAASVAGKAALFA